MNYQSTNMIRRAAVVYFTVWKLKIHAFSNLKCFLCSSLKALLSEFRVVFLNLWYFLENSLLISGNHLRSEIGNCNIKSRDLFFCVKRILVLGMVTHNIYIAYPESSFILPYPVYCIYLYEDAKENIILIKFFIPIKG